MMGQSSLFIFIFLTTTIPTALSQTSPAAGELRCQNPDGTLQPSATVCEDEIGSCLSVFGTAASGSTRSPLCDNDDIQDVSFRAMMKCMIDDFF